MNGVRFSEMFTKFLNDCSKKNEKKLKATDSQHSSKAGFLLIFLWVKQMMLQIDLYKRYPKKKQTVVATVEMILTNQKCTS